MGVRQGEVAPPKPRRFAYILIRQPSGQGKYAAILRGSRQGPKASSCAFCGAAPASRWASRGSTSPALQAGLSSRNLFGRAPSVFIKEMKCKGSAPQGRVVACGAAPKPTSSTRAAMALAGIQHHPVRGCRQRTSRVEGLARDVQGAGKRPQGVLTRDRLLQSRASSTPRRSMSAGRRAMPQGEGRGMPTSKESRRAWRRIKGVTLDGLLRAARDHGLPDHDGGEWCQIGQSKGGSWSTVRGTGSRLIVR